MADGKGWIVGIRDCFVQCLFNDMVYNAVVGSDNEVYGILGCDLGVAVVVEETEVAYSVNDVEIGGVARIWLIYVRVWIRHGILSVVHEDACVAHVGGGQIGNDHGLGDALVLQGMDGVHIGAANEGDMRL